MHNDFEFSQIPMDYQHYGPEDPLQTDNQLMPQIVPANQLSKAKSKRARKTGIDDDEKNARKLISAAIRRDKAREQEDLNNYLYTEIIKLRENQDILANALEKVMLEKRQLEEEVVELRNQQMEMKQLIVYPGGIPPRPERTEKPVVVYTFGMEPSVLRVNDAFCNLFGYQPQEVVGKSWKNLIDADFQDRTIRMFSHYATNMDKQLEMDQCYKHKNGGKIQTRDTCMILQIPGAVVMLVTINPVQTPFWRKLPDQPPSTWNPFEPTSNIIQLPQPPQKSLTYQIHPTSPAIQEIHSMGNDGLLLSPLAPQLLSTSIPGNDVLPLKEDHEMFWDELIPK